MRTVEVCLGAGNPVLGKSCTPGTATPRPMVADVGNCLRLTAFATSLGLFTAAQSSLNNTAAMVDCEAEVGNQKPIRDDHLDIADGQASPIAELTDERLAETLPGQNPEVTTLPPSWPEEDELFELVLAMFTRGTGVPAAPGKVLGVPPRASDNLFSTRLYR